MNKLLIWESSPSLKMVVHGRSVSSTYLHHHSFYELGIVLKGECQWHVGRRKEYVLEGEAILVKPRSPHREVSAPGRLAELAWLGFDFSGAVPAWSERSLSLGEDFSEIAALFRAIYQEHSSTDPLTRRRINLAVQSVVLLVSRRAGGPRRRALGRNSQGLRSSLNSRQARSVESAAHYFEQNFKDSLSIAQVAAYHSFCPAHFSTLFRKHFRISPRSFLQQAKLKKAEQLLTSSDLTLKEISSRCAFVDAAHLAKAFKKSYHLTPGAYRLQVHSAQRRS